MRNMKLRKMLLAAMFLALGVLLPLLVGHTIPMGYRLLPMHIPVLLCGFLCGAPWGLAVGFVTPLLNSLLTGMPDPVTAGAMMFELATYGLMAGALYRALPKKIVFLYAALIVAMIGGRVVWGAAVYVEYIMGLLGGEFTLTWGYLVSSGVLNMWMGIAIQIVLIPALMIALRRTAILREVTEDGNKGIAAEPLPAVSADADSGSGEADLPK